MFVTSLNCCLLGEDHYTIEHHISIEDFPVFMVRRLQHADTEMDADAANVGRPLNRTYLLCT